MGGRPTISSGWLRERLKAADRCRNPDLNQDEEPQGSIFTYAALLALVLRGGAPLPEPSGDAVGDLQVRRPPEPGLRRAWAARSR